MPRIDQLQKMLQAEPGDVFLNFALAMAYFKDGRHDEALAQYDHVSELDANYVPAYFQKGSSLATLGRIDEAKSTLRLGIEIANRVGDAHAVGEMQELLQSL